MIRRAQAVLALAAAAGAVLVASSAGQGPPGAAPPGLDQAIAAKQKHAERMLDKPGIAGIAVALNRAGKPVIRIYKEKDDVADLPDELDGVDVETVTTGVLEPYDHLPTHRYPRPVPIGVSAGLAGVATGTIGVRVTNGTNTYALSNNHVFAGVNTASIGDPIISPGDADGGSDPGDRIGTLAAYQEIDFSGGTNTMDAAIALTSAANVGTDTPADGYGPPSSVSTTATLGMGVQKYGRTTGFQLGTVAGTNVSVDVCYIVLLEFCLQEARFAGQISVSPGTFSAPGDSGSLIVAQGSNQPVALLFAGGEGLTIGSPIDPILQRFGVTIEGAPPGDGPPSAPTALNAVAGDASVSLSWNPPAFDGGSPISNYKLYRGTSSGSLSFHADAGTSTGYVDATAQNGTTYYYKVSAENANGEGGLSNESSATPSSLVLPADPLPTVDNFNRSENPLSDSGNWTNGIFSSVETGLYTTANTLACTKTTTCTAWRLSQYGPDAEAWARLSTLAGTGNSLRLYVRLQQPGTSAYDGYELRTVEQAGTDQVFIERVDNGVLVSRLTILQELAAGDTLLLRAKGTAIEAWRKPSGGSWSRLGVVQDATYAAAGRVGVGLRGVTGRLDDFGARTMGVPPPDTEPPTAPGTLIASVFSDTQIELTWGAATDDVGPISYRIERCAGSGCSNFAEIAAGTSTTHMDVGLEASTQYSYRVRAVDAADNEGPYSNTASAATHAPPDTDPPTAPERLNASATNSTQIDLTWDAATDNVGVALYRVERCQGAGCSDFSEIATTGSTSISNLELSPSTSYTYRVRAQDAVPNLGPYSGTANATTPAPPDTEPPTAPTGLVATVTSPTQINLSWQAASDNTHVALYRIERCAGAGCSSFGEIATTTSTSYSDTNLAASTSYTYRVRAQDAVPNLGPYSGTASATTPALPPVLPIEPLPTLDSFNRANENPLSGGWSNGVGGSAETGLRLRSNAIECTKTTTCTAWRTNPDFGPDVEVWARVSTLPGNNNQFRLYARLQQPVSPAPNGYMLRTNQLAGTDQVLLERLDAGALVTRLTISQELAVGDTILLRVKGSMLEAWLKRGSAWTLLGSVSDSTYAAAGRVGVGIRGKTGRLDDFGAR